MADINMNANINNYKGVMLCSRPNEQGKALLEKPFCSRVDPKIGLGLNPVPPDRMYVPEPKKRRNLVLARHKQWLREYTGKMYEYRQQEDVNRLKDKEFCDRVKNIGQKDRDRTLQMKREFEKLNDSIVADLDNKENDEQNLKALNAVNLKRLEDLEQVEAQEDEANINNDKEKAEKINLKSSLKQKKPQWSMTEKQANEQDDNECDELLNFVNTLDYDKYVDDLEVQSMIKAIKTRVNSLKKDENWRSSLNKKKVKHHDGEDGEQSVQDRDDLRSHASEQSHQSIQSLKQDLRDKNEGKQRDWDKTSLQKNTATIEEKIAKHVADEILRTYKNLSGHYSNASIRKILEKEAKNYLITSEQIQGPVITVSKDTILRKNEIDPNNLPYLHRNPAI